MFAIAAISSRQTIVSKYLQKNKGVNWNGLTVDDFVVVVCVFGSVVEACVWLATLTAVPLDLGSNPREDMDVCQCILPSRNGGTFNSRRVFHEVGGMGREVRGTGHPQGVLPQNWGETEINSSITCMVLKAMANDRRH
ncbi:cullin-4A [Trichonephila clavipes]|uniref:Cullin-4A n=1 Tax=Trichonephila clavipes TaxID=2585209 RepID=A0A8X6UY37_TRICX|nr:cullin-4A [Trichonephila clavipes]